MSETNEPTVSKRSLLGRLVRFFLKALGALLALIVVAIVVFNIYLSTRPAPKTVRAMGTIKVPAPFHVGRSFIVYMAIGGQRLYAGYASAGEGRKIFMPYQPPPGVKKPIDLWLNGPARRQTAAR